MKSLELFSGTGSFGKVAKELSIDNTSLDISARNHPTIQADILDWDYKQHKPNEFQIIWASPCCTEYSSCLTSRPRNLQMADRLVVRTFEIIRYFKPRLWFVENPYTGLLRKRPFMEDKQMFMKVVDYCKYGFEYRKRTSIWTNAATRLEPLCTKICRCDSAYLDPASKTWKHPKTFGTGPTLVNVHQRHRIPARLILDLILSKQRIGEENATGEDEASTLPK